MKKILSLITLLCCVVITQAQVKVKQPVKKAVANLFPERFCSAEMPHKTGIDKDTNTRAMAENYFLWDNGTELKVKFIGNGGSPLLRMKIMLAAKEWEKYANITFKQVENEPAQIRILVTDKGGCNSAVGTIASMKPEDEKTMNIDSNFFYQNGICYDRYLKQTIMHEFGHAIGLLHEHYYKGKIDWNKEVVYKEVLNSNGWNKEQVDFQIFSQYEALYTNGFAYDKLSIMHYGFPARWTNNNVEIKSNFELSEIDKQTVAYLYPKNAIRSKEFPRFVVSNLSPTKVINSSTRKGLVIYPSFNLTTSGRTGTFAMVAYLLTSDDKGVISPSNTQKFVADIKGGDLKPGLKMSINKLETNFEMFIPHSEIPAGLTNYKILLQLIVLDELNNEKKYLAADKVAYSQIKQQ